MEIFQKFRSKWTTDDLGVHPGQNERVIIRCFKGLGLTPVKELLSLYEIVDGKDDMDGEHFRLWPLNEIVKEHEHLQDKERALKYGVIFGDYCIDCWHYRVNGNGEVLVDYYDEENEPEIRARSLVEFFILMDTDPDEALL